jgi:hypothetical protein
LHSNLPKQRWFLSTCQRVERLRAWIEDLKQKLRQRLGARRTKQAISARAREIWEQNGCPVDRDLEFWLQAESEINERDQQ